MNQNNTCDECGTKTYGDPERFEATHRCDEKTRENYLAHRLNETVLPEISRFLDSTEGRFLSYCAERDRLRG